jgi:transcriptional regulator with XRE-family HTH domain
MADETDLHVGKRLRRRRRLLGMTQQDLASQVGVRFQQIQKYECGANRITASRLYELAKAMNVSVQYFFDGMPAARRKRWNWSAPITAWTNVRAAACSNWPRLLKAILPVTARPDPA